MREISTLNITNIMDLLMHISMRLEVKDTLDDEIKTCILKAESLLMSILHQDTLTAEWTSELYRHLNFYKERYKDYRNQDTLTAY